MRKLCSKWVPRLLTGDQKQQSVDDSGLCLQLFQPNKKEFWLVRLKEKIAKKEKKENVLFHQDNVLCHNSMATMVKLDELDFELLPHRPYFSDLAPATTGCLQSSNECCRERDLAPMKK